MDDESYRQSSDRPRTLSSTSVQGLSEYIKSGSTTKIIVLSGAGISTSAGIPDFRSETGLYSHIAKLGIDLPSPEAIFDISYFREKPEPFYGLASELFPGKFKPTITHSFIKLLHEKGLLLKHFTQNIDCLDREAGVPADKIVEAHGSFATQSCIDCKKSYPDEEMRKHVAIKAVPHCHSCDGLVKPNIVFFGEALPSGFFESRYLFEQADLVIAMGSSLTVHPFASLPYLVGHKIPRVLINKDRAGDFGSRADDVLLLGDCDDQIRQLAENCGWLEELEELWRQTGANTSDTQSEEVKTAKSDGEALEDEIDRLTQEIDTSLRLSKVHDEKTRKEIDENNARLDRLSDLHNTPAPADSNKPVANLPDTSTHADDP